MRGLIPTSLPPQRVLANGETQVLVDGEWRTVASCPVTVLQVYTTPVTRRKFVVPARTQPCACEKDYWPSVERSGSGLYCCTCMQRPNEDRCQCGFCQQARWWYAEYWRRVAGGRLGAVQ